MHHGRPSKWEQTCKHADITDCLSPKVQDCIQKQQWTCSGPFFIAFYMPAYECSWFTCLQQSTHRLFLHSAFQIPSQNIISTTDISLSQRSNALATDLPQEFSPQLSPEMGGFVVQMERRFCFGDKSGSSKFIQVHYLWCSLFCISVGSGPCYIPPESLRSFERQPWSLVCLKIADPRQCSQPQGFLLTSRPQRFQTDNLKRKLS